ncbi:serine hydrolase domain-containing protein [Chitinophaga alhagiae]|uniref:serine hydrolase domain-containing protein n=1 Tax=Chitinophaga alhagiae TaxID=2203219 RepID=UPI000E5AC1C3|nr:serine hydrolase domain-containing protein [Chitinophaga alhagiae]
MKRTACFFLAFFACQYSFSQSAKDSASVTKKAAALFAQWHRSDGPGLSVAVLKKEQVLFKRSYGMANLEYGVPMKSNTVMNVASLSKQFTAFSIALLASNGTISLSDDVHTYIPELPDYGHKISILHLVTHTAGLKDQYDLLYLAGWGPDDVITNQDALRLILQQKTLNFTPGKQFLYCNSGYSLLALIVERATGQSFPQWTKQHIFLPLGMNNTFFLEDYQQIIPGLAESYNITETGYKKSIIHSTTRGANGLHTTVDDLIKWVSNYSRKIAGNDSVIRMVENLPGNAGQGPELKYGFGQAITSYRGQKLIWHDGYDAGYRSYIGRFPDQELSIIISGNMELLDPKNIAMQLADIYLESSFSKGTSPSTAPQTKNIAPETVEKAIEGYYRFSKDSLLYIYVVDHNIYGKFANESGRFDIYRVSGNKFAGKDKPFQFAYQKARQGRADTMLFTVGSKTCPLAKLPDVDLSAYREYTGNYYCEELSVGYKIQLNDDKIVVVQPRNRVVTIKPIDTDHFGGEHWWLRDLIFQRDANKSVAGFEINNGRAKHIRFKKL